MTRMTQVGLLCEGCGQANGKRYCIECHVPLCHGCLKTSEKHDPETHRTLRTSGFVSALAFCDMCDWRPGSVYCEAEGTVLCHKCDTFLHSGKLARNHLRKPITKTIKERPASLVCEPSDSETESVRDGSVVEPPTSPPSSPVVGPPIEDQFELQLVPLTVEEREGNRRKEAEASVKKRELLAREHRSASGNNDDIDERFDPASSRDASGDGVTNNESNENASNGSNGDGGSSSMERTSICASGDGLGRRKTGKGSSRDSNSSGAVSGNGADKSIEPPVKRAKKGEDASCSSRGTSDGRNNGNDNHGRGRDGGAGDADGDSAYRKALVNPPPLPDRPEDPSASS